MRFKDSPAAIVAVCAAWIGSGLIVKRPPPQETKAKAVRAARVGVIESMARPVTAQITLTGTTRAHRSVALKAETKGRIIEVPAERGMRVRNGDLIARLAMDDCGARLAQADSLLKQREIEYAAATKLSDKAFTSRIQLAITKSARDAAAAELAATRTFAVEIALPLGQTAAHRISPAVLTLAGDGRVGVKTVNDANVVVFYPATLVREDKQGLWIGDLPQTIRLITVG